MLTYKIFKFTRPYCLLLLIKCQAMIVSNNFFTRPPKKLYHFTHILSFALQFLLFFSNTLFLFEYSLGKLFTADADASFGIENFFLLFTCEVFLHPDQFFEQKVQMRFLRCNWLICWSCNTCCCQSNLMYCCRLINFRSGTKFSQFSTKTIKFDLKSGQVELFTFMFNQESIKRRSCFGRALMISLSNQILLYKKVRRQIL